MDESLRGSTPHRKSNKRFTTTNQLRLACSLKTMVWLVVVGWMNDWVLREANW
jgi:hypothetical protein